MGRLSLCMGCMHPLNAKTQLEIERLVGMVRANASSRSSDIWAASTSSVLVSVLDVEFDRGILGALETYFRPVRLLWKHTGQTLPASTWLCSMMAIVPASLG